MCRFFVLFEVVMEREGVCSLQDCLVDGVSCGQVNGPV